MGTMWTSRSSSRISSGTRAATMTPLSPGPRTGAGCGPPLEVRLGVGFAEVERLQLPRLDELLADRPGVRQLDQRRRRRVRLPDRSELDAGGLVEHVGVAQGAVADHQAVVAA